MTEEELLQAIEQAAAEGWTELDLSGNELTVLPAEIGKLTQLKKLILGKYKYDEEGYIVGSIANNLSELPKEIGLLNQLEELLIVGNKLSELPAEIVQFTNLQTLDLNSNKLSELPAEIVQLTNLQSLDLSSNKLSSLPAEIVQLTNLQFLDLSSNKLSSLPAEIVQLTNLQFLYLNDNQLNSLPAEIVQLTNLQSLDLSFNQLSSLPVEIVQLTNLQSLDLYSNRLSSLPAEIGQLTNLQSLDLYSNHLISLPAEIGQLTNLQSLDLSDNQLSSLPAEIGQLINLQSLDLYSNHLISLPAEIIQLTNLQSFNLSDNQLRSIPAEIGQLSNLQSFNLSSNQLNSLPEEIKQLTNLQSLNLSFNQLSNLPKEIIQLTNLEFLDLGVNQLSSLPAEIIQLTNLQSFDLGENQLSSLPAEIIQLTKLEKLDLRGNPVPIPPEILGAEEWDEETGDVKEILDFYFRVQNPDETEPLYEAKLLIVGEGGAGKTSLAKKIENENYKLKYDEESTEGIDVIQWKFPLPNGKDFRVNIWDFGGQEIYHDTHQFFLTKRSFYVLVADSRKENTNFYWWLKVIELLSENSPVVIIKNEKQDRPCQIKERELRGEFTNLKEVLSTNLATNRGLAEIKEKIQNYISNLDHVGDKSPLPKLWVRVRSAIENYYRNYIELHEYYQLCETNNLTDRTDMLRLSRFLHDLGVCLHFQDDSILKHYVILKPEWATTAVYKVLDNKAVINNLGCFTQEQLADIWQDRKYRDMQDELLQLMMRFKLCYPIPNRSRNYIAPQLLDINQPAYSWDRSNNLILRYKYDFMPKGMLTRFIVETHPWIEQQKLVWKNGVVLNKDETRAEVIEYYSQREIKVRVSGNRKKDLLTVVNHELEKIHRSFERLQYQTLVPCNCEECAGSENPYSYALENLRKRLNAGRYQVECENSYEMVDVRRLIDDVNLSLQPEFRKSKVENTPLQRELESERSINLNVNIQNHNQSTSESTSMSNINDQSRKVNIGGDATNISGGAFNLGEISGTVANTINQLPASPESDKPGIKELLEQLKTAIESESNLSDDDKVTALEEVETLAEAGQKPQEGAMQKQAKRAILALKGLVSSLPAAAKLAESVQKLVPMISHIFGF